MGNGMGERRHVSPCADVHVSSHQSIDPPPRTCAAPPARTIISSVFAHAGNGVPVRISRVLRQARFIINSFFFYYFFFAQPTQPCLTALSTAPTRCPRARSCSRYAHRRMHLDRHAAQSGSEYVFLKTAADRSQYRLIMLFANGLALVRACPRLTMCLPCDRPPLATAWCPWPPTRTRSSKH